MLVDGWVGFGGRVAVLAVVADDRGTTVICCYPAMRALDATRDKMHTKFLYHRLMCVCVVLLSFCDPSSR